MRRRKGWEGEREREGGEGNLRLDGSCPALPLASARQRTSVHSRALPQGPVEGLRNTAMQARDYHGQYPRWSVMELHGIPNDPRPAKSLPRLSPRPGRGGRGRVAV